MATVTLNHFAGGGLTNGVDGYHMSVTGQVTGLDTTAPVARRELDALNTAGVPQRHQPHPHVSLLVVASVNATIIKDTPSAAALSIEYASVNIPGLTLPEANEWGPVNVAVEDALQGEETSFFITQNFDRFGRQIKNEASQIIVQHQFDLAGKVELGAGGEVVQLPFDPVDLPLPGENFRGGVVAASTITVTPGGPGHALVTCRQAGTVAIEIPTHTVVLTRDEPESPGAKSKAFLGTVNANPIFGDGPRMWLCTRLGGFSDDGNQTFHVTYAFTKNLDGWDATVIYVDGETGQPVPLADAQPLSIQTFPIYRETEFRDLNLTW